MLSIQNAFIGQSSKKKTKMPSFAHSSKEASNGKLQITKIDDLNWFVTVKSPSEIPCSSCGTGDTV